MKTIIVAALLVMAAPVLLIAQQASGQGSAQPSAHRYWAEGYGFLGRRSGTPGTNIGGAGGDVFILKGLAAGGEVGTTIGNPDDKITIWSADASYHFFCCRANRRVEPFAGAGFSYLTGDIKTPDGVVYPDSSNYRTGPNFNQGLIVWATKHVGVRFELREYRMFVSYGALEDAIPGGNPIEFHIGLTFR